MDIPNHTTAVAIVPCTDIDAAESWWRRLGFTCADGDDYGDYRILGDSAGGWVHLTVSPPGWLVPVSNPFGVYLYTSRVDELAVEFASEILGPVKGVDLKPWGMREFALNGPDDLLVRIGWPSDRTP